VAERFTRGHDQGNLGLFDLAFGERRKGQILGQAAPSAVECQGDAIEVFCGRDLVEAERAISRVEESTGPPYVCEPRINATSPFAIMSYDPI